MHQWSLSDLALRRPVSVAMGLIAILVLGVVAMFRLPLAFMPTQDEARAMIRVEIASTSPEILERDVIRPIEEAIAGIRDLREMRAGSGSWGARFVLDFAPDTDLDARKIEMRERVERIRSTLPDIVQRIEITPAHGMADSPLLEIQIGSDRSLANEYYLIQERIVRPIERTLGVARVELSGVEPHELDISFDLDEAKRRGVSLQSVTSQIRQAGQGRTLGSLIHEGKRVGVRTPGIAADPESYARLSVPARTFASGSTGANSADTAANQAATDAVSNDSNVDSSAAANAIAPASEGQALPIREIAQVSLHPREQRGGSRLNGKPAINASVYASADASAVEVSAAILRVLEDVRKDPSLGNVEIHVSQDQGEMLLNSLGDLRNTGIFGGGVAILVLFAFLHRIRPTIAAAMAIPLSIVMVCGTLFLRGSNLDSIVLLGMVLSVGMLVDNAVVIVESIQNKMHAGYRARAAVLLGAREVSLPTLTSTLSTIIVFLPLMFGGKDNPMLAYTGPLGMTFVSALIASLLVSQAAIPLVMGRFMTGETRPTNNRILDRCRVIYAKIIRISTRRPAWTLVLGFGLAASVFVPATQLEVKLGRLEDDGVALPISLEMTGSLGVERVVGHLSVLESALLARREELGIESLACRYRDAFGHCEAFPAHPVQNATEQSNFEQAIRAALPEQPGLRYRVGDRGFWGRGNNDPRNISFVIRGEDMTTLVDLSRRLGKHLENELPRPDPSDPSNPDKVALDRVMGPYNEGSEEIHIRLDRERLLALGVKANSVATAVSAAFAGNNLGVAQGPNGEVTLKISTRSENLNASEQEPTLADLQDFRVSLPNGGQTPLTSLAALETVYAPFWVQRVNRQTEVKMNVYFTTPDRMANQELIDRALATFSFPEGYTAGEQFKWWERGEENYEMVINLGLALLLVYAVIASLFESLVQPLGILLVALLGCIGAPWALFLTHTTLDSIALIGFFMLIGVVVNNGIMLIDKTTQFRNAGMERGDALLKGAVDRLRPIFMTVSTSIVGLLPMLIHHPSVAGVYYHAIAIVLVGGLLSSTAFTLIFLPSAYIVLEDFSRAASAVWQRIVEPQKRSG
jgi:HAE1 family hydrophobic/amphiphilic exporter-1